MTLKSTLRSTQAIYLPSMFFLMLECFLLNAKSKFLRAHSFCFLFRVKFDLLLFPSESIALEILEGSKYSWNLEALVEKGVKG